MLGIAHSLMHSPISVKRLETCVFWTLSPNPARTRARARARVCVCVCVRIFFFLRATCM